MMMLGWVLAILFIIWLIREIVEGKQDHDGFSNELLAIAQRRYSEGEISRDEFQTIVDDLVLVDHYAQQKNKRNH